MPQSGMDSESDDDVTLGDNFDLSKIFDTASKLKSAQLSKIRKDYDTSPGFIKATHTYASRNNEWKDLSITEKLEKCESWKEEGNSLFKKKESMQALSSYSQGISIFRYFEKRDERGEHLELKDYIREGYNHEDPSIVSFWE
eukprot:30529_1